MGCRHALNSRTSLGLHRSPSGGSARPGFSLIELLATMLTIGILVAITLPPARETTATARAGALAGRVRAVQLAYAAAELPLADAERAEAGVELTIVGDGGDVWLRLEATTPDGRRTLASFHRMARIPSLRSGGLTLVPLSEDAASLMETIRAVRAGATSTSGAMSEEMAPTSGAAAVVGDDTGGETAEDRTDASAPSLGGSELRTGESKDGSDPVCSPSLPPAQYRRCIRSTSPGWERP